MIQSLSVLRNWWWSRLRPTDRWTLTQRSIYIVPTRAGLAFAATLLVMLLAAINYQLSLGYALTFLLAGSAVVSMHVTHGDLRGLNLHLRQPKPAFAGDRLELTLVVSNPGAARHGIGLGVASLPDRVWVEVDAQSQTIVTVAWPGLSRGRHAAPVLVIESRFPFGLFRAWSLWRPDAKVWVYPRPEQPPPGLPPGPTSGHQGSGSPGPSGGEEPDGVRPWRRGDRARQVAWKKVARSGELVSLELRQPSARGVWLDWSATPSSWDDERRLSRVTAWVLLAERQGRPYGLRLPGQRRDAGLGPAHQTQLLEDLAQWA